MPQISNSLRLLLPALALSILPAWSTDYILDRYITEDLNGTVSHSWPDGAIVINDGPLNSVEMVETNTPNPAKELQPLPPPPPEDPPEPVVVMVMHGTINPQPSGVAKWTKRAHIGAIWTNFGANCFQIVQGYLAVTGRR